MKGRIACLLFLASVAGVAGPPFRTDDPEPVEPGHLEFYVFGLGQRVPGDSSGVGPALEFNYGILPDTQFHLVVPWAYDRPRNEPSHSGRGDTELGLKVRLLHETEERPQIGVFPLVEHPTGDAVRGLGAGHTQIYLPVWIQKGWGAWTTYGGWGWWRNPGEGQRNWTYAGWLLQRDFGENLTLGAEFFHSTASALSGRTSSGFDLGGQVNASGRHHILFSLGRNVSGDRQTYGYLGYQFTAGPFGTLADWLKKGRNRGR